MATPSQNSHALKTSTKDTTLSIANICKLEFRTGELVDQ